MKTKLIIGDKHISSWSLRPWLLMKFFKIPFEEITIPLKRPETNQNILQYSPSGKVPALLDGDLLIWDSLSIMEYLHEKYPEKKMYPQNISDRAHARSVSMEMHSGFAKMRERLNFDLKKNLTDFDFGDATPDIERIKHLWKTQLEKSGGPFLFGDFSIADAMFAPVVAGRFKSYGVPVEGVVKKYCETILNLSEVKLWCEEALKE